MIDQSHFLIPMSIFDRDGFGKRDSENWEACIIRMDGRTELVGLMEEIQWLTEDRIIQITLDGSDGNNDVELLQ